MSAHNTALVERIGGLLRRTAQPPVFAPSAAVNSYAELVEWLRDDLEEVTTLAAANDVDAFLAELRAHIDAVYPSGQELPPEVLRFRAEVEAPLRSALDQIALQTSTSEKLAILNGVLREVYTKTWLTKQSYAERATALTTGALDEVSYRLRSPNPLPTLDAIYVLARDTRPLTQLQRAALLAVAALRLHVCAIPAADDRGMLQILGTSVVPGEHEDHLVVADGEPSILVLAASMPYLVHLGPNPSAVDPAALRDILAAIQVDAAATSTQPDKDSAPLPSLLTAAARASCRRVRSLLSRDADNARALALIDRCLFEVCLDTPKTAPAAPVQVPNATPEVGRRMFCNHPNRWFGITQIVVDDEAEAGIILSYTRGINAAAGLKFSTALYNECNRIRLPPEQSTPAHLNHQSGSVERLDLRRGDLGMIPAQVRVEIAAIFHSENAFFRLSVGADFFRSIGLSPNSALQYLILLAAHEVWGRDVLPALSQAVSTQTDSQRHGSLDWVLVSTRGMLDIARKWQSQPGADSVLLQQFRSLVKRHAAKVKAAKRGYSPTFFLRQSHHDLEERLGRLFIALGNRYAASYGGYLFRPTRAPRTMDILTSTLDLPASVQCCGRPGATCEATEMLGMHIFFKSDSVDLVYLPNPRSVHKLPAFHAALEAGVVRLQRLAAGSRPERDATLGVAS